MGFYPGRGIIQPGTFLVVTDPVGRLLKTWLKKGLKEKQEKESDDRSRTRWNHAIKAVKTRAIGIKIDKIVSMSYLVIILGVFSTAISHYPSFASDLVKPKIH